MCEARSSAVEAAGDGIGATTGAVEPQRNMATEEPTPSLECKEGQKEEKRKRRGKEGEKQQRLREKDRGN